MAISYEAKKGKVDMVKEAWVTMPAGDEIRAARSEPSPYDFGFVPAMGRLLMTHPRIGGAFSQLFAEIMFAPGVLSRAEREMVAAVAAAAQDCYY